MKFPIGIQSFERVIEDGYIYVDKTDLVYKLTHEGSIYFLSRPRRFGKSLLVSTLENYYLGRKELFRGLAIESVPYRFQQLGLYKRACPGGKTSGLCTEMGKEICGTGK